MADNIALIKLEVQVADGQLKIDNLKSKLKGLTKGGEDYNLVVKRIQIAEDNLNKIQSKKISIQSNLDKSTKRLTKTQQQAKDATGAYTSSALELGRVISDAPYGIRGMANNLTQLISQMGFAAKSAGGLGAAFKGLWTALMGPLGVVLAFTTVISALDYFFGANEKAEESTNDLTQSINEFADVLRKNANASIKEYLQLMIQKKTLDENLKKASEKIIEVEEKLAKATEMRVVYENNLKKAVHNRDLIQKQLNKASEYELKLQKELEGIYTDSASAINKYKESKDKLKDSDEVVIEGSLKGLKQLLSEQESYRERVSTTKTEYDAVSIVIAGIKKQIEEIEGKKTKGTKNKISPFKSKRELDLDVKNQENALLQLERKTRLQALKNSELEELSSAKTEKEKTEIKRRYAPQRLEIELNIEKKKLILAKSNERQIAKIKHDEHVANLKRILEEYKLELKLKKPKNADELKKSAETETQKSIVQAGAELIKTNKEIDDAYKPLFKTFKDLADLRRKALGISPEDKKAPEAASLEQYLDQVKQLMSSVGDFISAEYDRQLTIEGNHTAKLNEELNNRLLNENLSANERKKIQNQIAINDENLRKKQNAIKKKQFNANKAFNISTALIDTYLAASKAFKTFGGYPTGIAPMALSIAKGLANVAMIARQKFQPEAASTPARVSGGGGGGGSDRSFNFNLVGNTVGNQITDAIQGQFDKPLKAYVVSRDVTNQQALDANIKGAASF